MDIAERYFPSSGWLLAANLYKFFHLSTTNPLICSCLASRWSEKSPNKFEKHKNPSFALFGLKFYTGNRSLVPLDPVYLQSGHFSNHDDEYLGVPAESKT